MNRSDWLAAADPDAMLAFLAERELLSHRQILLFEAACCRRAWHLLGREMSRRAVQAAEAHADGQTDAADLGAAKILAHQAISGTMGDLVSANSVASADGNWSATVAPLARYHASCAALWIGENRTQTAISLVAEALAYIRSGSRELNGPAASAAHAAERATQAALLRDVIGTPTVARSRIDPDWLVWDNGIVRQLAESAYEHRLRPSGHLDGQRLAVLSDALEEAGCADADLLSHLRSPGPHVRGCWALDLLTGKG